MGKSKFELPSNDPSAYINNLIYQECQTNEKFSHTHYNPIKLLLTWSTAEGAIDISKAKVMIDEFLSAGDKERAKSEVEDLKEIIALAREALKVIKGEQLRKEVVNLIQPLELMIANYSVDLK